MQKMRGGLFETIRSYMISTHSRDFFKTLISKLEVDHKELFKNIIIYNEFYDAKAYQQLLEVFRQKVSEDEYIRCAEHLAKQDLKGLFLFIARMLSKQKLISKMNDMWNKLHSHGSLSLLEDSDDFTSVQVTDWEFNLAHLKHAEFYMRTVLEMTTKDSYNSKSKSISDMQHVFQFRRI
jgi:hypothetical protein